MKPDITPAGTTAATTAALRRPSLFSHQAEASTSSYSCCCQKSWQEVLVLSFGAFFSPLTAGEVGAELQCFPDVNIKDPKQV